MIEAGVGDGIPFVCALGIDLDVCFEKMCAKYPACFELGMDRGGAAKCVDLVVGKQKGGVLHAQRPRTGNAEGFSGFGAVGNA